MLKMLQYNIDACQPRIVLVTFQKGNLRRKIYFSPGFLDTIGLPSLGISMIAGIS
jgi:hypothetical protein